MREMRESGVEWIDTVPTAWQTLTIGSLFKVRNEKVNDTEYPPLSVTKGGIVPQMENVAKSDANDNRKMVLANDFVINSRSDRKQSCGVSPLDGSVSLINTVLYPAKDAPIVPAYLNYLLKNYGFAEEFYRWGHGIVADLWTTRWQEMKSILLPIPSMEEQMQILETISAQTDKVDTLIANVQAQIEKLNAYKQSVITEVVTKGLDPTVPMKDSEVEWVGKIPAHWDVVKTGRLFKENNRKPIGNDTPLSLSQVDGLIATDDMKESSLKTSTYENWKRVELGDLVLNRFKAHLGVLFAATLTGIVSFHYGVYEARRKLVPKFYEYLYHADQYKAILGNASNGMVVGLQNLSNLNFYTTYSLCPSYEEQEEIVAYLDDKCSQIDRLITIKQAKIDKLEQYKKSLIYEYVTGKKEAR